MEEIRKGNRMKKSNGNWKGALSVAAVAVMMAYAGVASATAIGGVFSTDRFGYTGTVVRYDTLADAQNGLNAQESIAIGVDVAADDSREHRDASFYFVDNAGAYDTDYNILTSSWWYTTAGSAGHGNINGNTGIGFMQLYDNDGNTDTSVSMDFSNFDGTHWTDFTLSAQGTNATAADDYARFSVYENVHDAGTYLEYDLNITASGLEGVQAGNEIVANNHATGVNGTFSGLFVFGGDGDGDIYTGFYTIDLVFDMENWAFANNGSLDGAYQNGGDIYDSLFVAVQPVPEPATMSLLLMGLGGAGSASS
jgi:hypothetical protein